MRDSITRKPAEGRELSIWRDRVIDLRRRARNALDGNLDPDRLRAWADDQGPENPTVLRIMAYERLGHEKSLRDHILRSAIYRSIGEVSFNPPKRHWVCENKKERLFVYGSSPEEMLDRLAEKEPGAQTGQRRKPKASPFIIYTYKARPDEFWIGRKVGKGPVNIISFASSADANRFRTENPERLEEMFEAIRRDPLERGDMNQERTGPDRRGGRDITPEVFTATFGLRGVQFGNYVEGARRQQDLNNAYDAFLDLADALGIEPEAISLNGRLGLAFGARGRGGKGAAAAHFETLQFVINLTKINGRGSLAHEWFHALDNAIGRKAGGKGAFATTMPGRGYDHLTLEDRQSIAALSRITDSIRKTDIWKRSAYADRFRSSVYYSEPFEMSARSFEAWVIDRLETLGIRNDYLANILDEKSYELIGQDIRKYPFPLAGEMGKVRDMFGHLFAADGALSFELGGSDPTLTAPRNVAEPVLVMRMPDVPPPERAPAAPVPAPERIPAFGSGAAQGELFYMPRPELPQQAPSRGMAAMPQAPQAGQHTAASQPGRPLPGGKDRKSPAGVLAEVLAAHGFGPDDDMPPAPPRPLRPPPALSGPLPRARDVPAGPEFPARGAHPAPVPEPVAAVPDPYEIGEDEDICFD